MFWFHSYILTLPALWISESSIKIKINLKSHWNHKKPHLHDEPIPFFIYRYLELFTKMLKSEAKAILINQSNYWISLSGWISFFKLMFSFEWQVERRNFSKLINPSIVHVYNLFKCYWIQEHSLASIYLLRSIIETLKRGVKYV